MIFLLNVPVVSIMTPDPVTISLDASLAEVRALFDQHRFRHLLVVENRKLFGVISDRDMFRALGPGLGTRGETDRDLATLRKRAHQIVSRRPIKLPEDAHIQDAITLFDLHRISCLPVVDANLHPIGVVSLRDINRHLKRMIMPDSAAASDHTAP